MVIWQKAGQGVQKKVKKLNQNNFIVYERGMGSCLCCGSAFAQQTTFVKRIEETRQYAVTGKAARSHENRLVNMHRQASITNDCCLLWLRLTKIWGQVSDESTPARTLPELCCGHSLYSTMDSTAQQLNNNNPPSWLLAPYCYITINVVFLPHPCVANEAHSLQLAAVSNHFSNK